MLVRKVSIRQPRLGNWWTDLIGAQPIQVPLSPQEQQDLANAAVRAHGIDPATGKLISPLYAATVAGQLKIDPNDPQALKAAADKVRSDALARLTADFDSFKQDHDSAGASTIPWGKVALYAGAGILGTVAVVKAMK